MARKKKRRFSAVKAVKSAARQHLGMPAPTRVVPDAKTKAARRAKKHKPSRDELVSEQDK
ncbi:MAG: hypothetical protein ABSD88_15095 [Candidatus Korobacteraceae bacterium]